MTNQLDRLKSLRAEVNAKQFQIETLKAIASSKQGEVLRPLIEADELHLAKLQGELATLTAEVTKTIDETFSAQPVMKQVMKLRELEGMTFDSIARRLQCSLRWVLELHKRGLELMTVTNSTPLATGYTR